FGFKRESACGDRPNQPVLLSACDETVVHRAAFHFSCTLHGATQRRRDGRRRSQRMQLRPLMEKRWTRREDILRSPRRVLNPEAKMRKPRPAKRKPDFKVFGPIAHLAVATRRSHTHRKARQIDGLEFKQVLVA